MVLGALWCPTEKTREINDGIRAIKHKHKLSPDFEIKWTKVSKSKVNFYLDLIEYFFENPLMHFRGVVVADKTHLDHQKFKQDHDTWYYKMYFLLLNRILQKENCYHIYLDIKDTCGSKKREKLHGALCNVNYDFDQKIIDRVQVIRSDEVGLMQLADLLIGVLSYVNRGLKSNEGKTILVERVRKRSGYTLTRQTLISEPKFNILVWNAQES